MYVEVGWLLFQFAKLSQMTYNSISRNPLDITLSLNRVMIQYHRVCSDGENFQDAEGTLADRNSKGCACSTPLDKKGLWWFAIIGLILTVYAINPFRFLHNNDKVPDSSTQRLDNAVKAIDNTGEGLMKCKLTWRHKKVKLEVYERASKCNNLAYTNVTSFKLKRLPLKLVNESPTFKMDRNKFIIPILDGGPNNQLFELRETIFLAIKLKRTLVIPRFFKHFTDRLETTN